MESASTDGGPRGQADPVGGAARPLDETGSGSWRGPGSPPRDDAITSSVRRSLGLSASTARAGDFELQAELGRGASGCVLRAVHRPTGRLVALKVLLGGARSSPRERRRLEREGQALAELDHPGIVGVLAAGALNERPFLALELVEGQSLRDRLRRRGPLGPREAATLARHVADALHYAHERGVVHRDLKPENLLLDRLGRVRVADFGTAADVDLGWTQLTQSGVAIGTPAYTPPEQIGGRRGRASADARTDVYGLGAVLFELLTGQAPFAGRSQIEVLTRVTSEPPPRPRAHQPEVPRALDAVVARALAKTPKARYPSAAALRDDLDRFLTGRPVAAERRLHARRAVVALFAIAALLAVAVVAAALAKQPTPGPTAGSPPAGTPAPTAGSPPAGTPTPTAGSPPAGTPAPAAGSTPAGTPGPAPSPSGPAAPAPDGAPPAALAVLCDFEADPSPPWRASGAALATVTPLPSGATAPEGAAPLPGGRGLHVRTTGPARVIWPGAPSDWRACEELVLWVYLDADEAAADPVVLDLELREADGRARLWRKVVLGRAGWTRIAVAPRWLRWGGGRFARLDHVAELAVTIREPASLWIDAVARRPGRPDAGLRTAEDLRAVLLDGGGRVARRDGFAVLADDPDLDLERLADDLAPVRAEVRRLLADLPPWSERDAFLVLSPSPADYHARFFRLVDALGATAPVPTSDAFQVQEVAFSATKGFAGVRPAHVTALCLALLEPHLGLHGARSWLERGLTFLVRNRVHEGALAEYVQRGAASGSVTPLPELCDGGGVRAAHYWQAATLVEVLAEGERFRARWPDLLRAIRQAGSGALLPHVEQVLRTDWALLEGAWRNHCRERYGATFR